eukprot:scaffold104224_cov57-Phaeocystis_antarctica.AAC.2
MYGRFANSCFEFVFLVLEISFVAVERSLARGSCEGVPQCTVVCVTKVKVWGIPKSRREVPGHRDRKCARPRRTCLKYHEPRGCMVGFMHTCETSQPGHPHRGSLCGCAAPVLLPGAARVASSSGARGGGS